ncbi:hypothetical protein L3049_16730 [Labilibaculum sp. DW002]|uniref:Uncharacterized protein n=1 Tax=Paralabilibaculum antarcticum TaxID=2912572 RepID=A0ABT5VZA0_9BACT|nr:hypothetical protein [Labilibaculum sp. DW002]MDE5419639.1 hypothetical protein [Labilibaculum sp. DW002]
MIVFKSKIHSNKDKAFLERSLKQRLLSFNEFPTYIFPFFLFSKAFYRDLKESSKGLYEGRVTNGEFELSRTSKVFSTRTWLPMMIKGRIVNNEISIKGVIPNYILLLTVVLILTDSIFNTELKNFDNVLFLLAGLISVSYIFKIIREQFIFRRICT